MSPCDKLKFCDLYFFPGDSIISVIKPEPEREYMYLNGFLVRRIYDSVSTQW